VDHRDASLLAAEVNGKMRACFTSNWKWRLWCEGVRWRPDKAPRHCTLSQVEHRSGANLRLLA